MENGAENYYLFRTVKTKKIEIKEGNIKFVFEFNDQIYFIEGLAHLSYSGGAIFELKKDGENFTYKSIMEFDDAPEAFTIYGNKLLIACLLYTSPSPRD